MTKLAVSHLTGVRGKTEEGIGGEARLEADAVSRVLGCFPEVIPEDFS